MPEDYNVQMLELEEIQPSPTNPRTRFSEEALADLAESIRQKGVMQPILVRPRRCDFRIEAAGNRWAVLNATGVTLETCDTEEDAQDAMRLFWERQPQFELVAGERRWRASKLAGEETIPAIVRQLSDLSALEFQVVENLQRADLSAMEEAEGYRRMTRDYGYTVESLAEKIGKSKAYVYARLKLAEQLPPQAIEALERGQFSTSVAELIGILAWAVRGCHDWLERGFVLPAAVRLATEEYQRESDNVGEFISECCVTGEEYSIRAGDLYQAYTAWSEGQGARPKSSTAFGSALTGKGFPSEHAFSGKIRRGIALMQSTDR